MICRRRIAPRRPIVRIRAPRVAAFRPQWRPIGLMWRNRATVMPAHRVQGGKTVVRTDWSPRFAMHFHFAMALARHATRRARVRQPIITWRPLQSQLTSALPLKRAFSEIGWQRQINHYLRTASSRLLIRHKANSSEIHRTFRADDGPRRLGHPILCYAAQRPGRPALAIASAHASAPVVSLAPPTWRKQAPMTFALGRKRDASNVVNKAAVAPQMPLRRIEFVWRADPDLKAGEAGERSLIGATTPVLPQAAAPSFHSPEQLPSIVSSIQQRVLDPALIDRVAEDVIGRVERRIRIERERRGV